MGNAFDRVREEGREDGLREGRIEAIKNMALNMLKLGSNTEDIAAVTNLSPDDIKKLKAQIL